VSDSKSNNKKTNPSLEPVNRRFLSAIDQLVFEKVEKNAAGICDRIGMDRSTLSKLKKGGRSITIPQLATFIVAYGLNPAFFFYEDKDLKATDPELTAQNFGGTQSINVGGDNSGKIQHNAIGEQIVNNAPPKLKKYIKTLLSETEAIKKIAFDKQLEIDQEKKRYLALEKRYFDKSDEADRFKDELFEIFRQRNAQLG